VNVNGVCCLDKQVSDADGYLERTFMSPASVRAGNLIRGWMEDAGLRTLAFYLFAVVNS
jgi:allantoate deiminase